MRIDRPAATSRGGGIFVATALVLFAAVAHAQAPPVIVAPQSDPVPIFVPPAPATSGPTPLIVPAPEAAPQPIGSPVTVLPAPTQMPAFGANNVGQTSMRDVFVGTLAAAAQATGTKLVMDLAQVVTGGLANWFSRKLDARAQAAQQAAAATLAAPNAAAPALIAPPVTPPVVAPVVAPTPTNLPAPVAFGDASAPQPLGPPAVQFFDAQTGNVAAADPVVLAAPMPTGGAGDALFAGLAYEVHALQSGGATLPVNPATHEFRTGDRFIVLYRPTLPGRMDVYNVNPAGRRTQIDSAELAGGQLARLGPYEFSAMTGDEQLRLVLTPCSTPELTLATRDIVKVSDIATTPGAGLNLANCGGLATRSIDGLVTRDIRKVAVEGTTGFALDPIAAEERESGRLAPREVTINFRHR
ncbi:MAG: hypothetical protein NDI84_15740 [Steroidobacteraceae bacterium]|nr:hypothetical protein [Steroidobacteraceae bacterium]